MFFLCSDFFQNEPELLTTPITSPSPFVPVLNGADIIAFNNGGVVESLLTTPLLPSTDDRKEEIEDSCIKDLLK